MQIVISLAVCVAGIIMVSAGIRLRSSSQAGLLYALYSTSIAVLLYLAFRAWRYVRAPLCVCMCV